MYLPPTASEQDQTDEHEFNTTHLIQEQPCHTTRARYPMQQSTSHQSKPSLPNNHNCLLQGHYNPANNRTMAFTHHCHPWQLNPDSTVQYHLPRLGIDPSNWSTTPAACLVPPLKPYQSLLLVHHANNIDHLDQLLITVQAFSNTSKRLSTALSLLISLSHSTNHLAHIQPQASHHPQVDQITHALPHPILLFDITMTQGHHLTAIMNWPSISHWPILNSTFCSNIPQLRPPLALISVVVDNAC